MLDAFRPAPKACFPGTPFLFASHQLNRTQHATKTEVTNNDRPHPEARRSVAEGPALFAIGARQRPALRYPRRRAHAWHQSRLARPPLGRKGLARATAVPDRHQAT